ncbi:MAG: PD40 domain-containing protein [Anaerolineae bacterium]|nr:PD40 domain-containing protein [Anaerolineae bacterium]
MSHTASKFARIAITVGVALLLTLAVLAAGALAKEPDDAAAADYSRIAPRMAGISAHGAISPTSNFVLFERPDGEDSMIWLLTDGITQTAIITGHRPRLSNDGQSLVYLGGDAVAVYSDIYVYDLNTGVNTKIFSNWDSVVYYSWASDDSRIYYDFRCNIYAMDPDGSNNEEIIGAWPDASIKRCYNDNPNASPVDGRLVWENEYFGIGIANGDGSNPAWIPNTQPGDFDPRWSPDGQWIAFFRDSDAADDDNLFKIRPDGSALTQLTFLAGDDTNEMEWLGGWTADGQFVVSSGEIAGVQGIYAVAANGSGLATILLQEAGADQYFIGNAGLLDIAFRATYLPLVLR